MANPVIHVYYRASDGCICAAQYGEPGAPVDYPASNGHDTTLEVALMNHLPTGETHKVDTTTTPHTVVSMSPAEITAKQNAERKTITEHSLGKYYVQQAEMVKRGFDTTEIDTIIAQCEADLAEFSS